MSKLAELPVTMDGTRPTITAQINGVDALFLLDSGAYASSLTPAAAEQYHLTADGTRRPDLWVEGVGGGGKARIARVATFTIFNAPVHNFGFLVAGSDTGRGTVGLLGQDILRLADIEYDLAQGTVRIFEVKDCMRANLAYWSQPGQAYSMLDIEPVTPRTPHTVGSAYLNGAKIRVTFDTGASISIVGLRAAAKAGIKPGGAGVEPARPTSGIGKRTIDTWIANFPSLKIGDEEVRNARLRFGDLGDLDLLLGADFFLSHRIFVANGQRKVFFTYNGGPVFNLTAPSKVAKTGTDGSDEPGAVTATGASSVSDPSIEAASHTDGSLKETGNDAPTIARRAAAYAARHDFEHALQDFNRACELAPNEPSYYYQRGVTRLNSLQQPDQGARDINQAIELKPDYVDALLVRAEIALRKNNAAQAIEDLNTVDRVAPKEANLRLTLASLYTDADRMPEAIAQLDLWIPRHSQDVSLSHALNDRCWARALLGQALDQALSDCNAGLRREAHSAELLDSRGLVQLRRGAYDQSIADYDAALKIDPKGAWSLYCRGLAKRQVGKNQEAATDMAAAMKLDPQVAAHVRQYGIGAG